MAAINDVIDLGAQGDIAIVTVNSPPVDALSERRAARGRALTHRSERFHRTARCGVLRIGGRSLIMPRSPSCGVRRGEARYCMIERPCAIRPRRSGYRCWRGAH